MGIQINGQTDTVTAIDGSLNVGGDVTIPGVLTYDDVTNVDSVGVITARNGIDVTGGSVGIGTDVPEDELHVLLSSSSDGPSLRLTNPNGGDGTYTGRISTGDAAGTFFAGINFLKHDSNDGEIRFRTKVNGSNQDTVTIVDSNVGIGTDNPDTQLQVFDSSTTGNLKIGGGNGAGNHRVFISCTETNSYIDSYGNNAYGKLRINASPLILNDAGGGSVGIGSEIPTQTLDVMSANPVIRLTDTDPSGVYSQIDGAGGDLILAADGGAGSSDSFVSIRTDGTDANAERLRITSGGDTELRNRVVGVTNTYSQYLKFRTTQTNGQSAVTGAIAAQGKASWGGDLVFYTKEANATPNDTVRETLRVDTAGRITKPYQPRFFTYATSSIAVTSSGYRTVDIWNQTRFNVGSHFSTSTNKFIAPIAGCYAFGTQVRLDAADTGYFRLILSVNDSIADNEQAHSITDTGSTGNSYHTMAITALYELSAGNSVKVVVEGNTDSSYTIQSESQFWGYLVA